MLAFWARVVAELEMGLVTVMSAVIFCCKAQDMVTISNRRFWTEADSVGPGRLLIGIS